MAENRKTYSFGEKETENMKGKIMPVWQTPKYQQSKEAAIKLLNSKEFGGILSENDFWILKNAYANGEKLQYSGLIITHEALLKINEALDDSKKFNEKYCSEPIAYEYNGKRGLLMHYRDERDGMYEIGEISSDNLFSSAYPFAMLLKRTFDRVVKRKAGLTGIFSESESEDFHKEPMASEPDMEINMKSKKGRRINIPSETMEESTFESQAVDTETGEILVDNEISLESALDYVLMSRTNSGKTVRTLLESPNLTDLQKSQFLAKYIAGENEEDRKACLRIKEAIDSGLILFKNSKVK